MGEGFDNCAGMPFAPGVYYNNNKKTRSEPKIFKCESCGKEGLKWKKVFGENRYLPVNKDNGFIHYCDPKPGARQSFIHTAQWHIMLHVRCPFCEESFDASTKDFWKTRKKSVDSLLYKRNQKIKCPYCNESFYCHLEANEHDWMDK